MTPLISYFSMTYANPMSSFQAPKSTNLFCAQRLIKYSVSSLYVMCEVCDENAMEKTVESGGGCPYCVCKPGFAGPGQNHSQLMVQNNFIQNV